MRFLETELYRAELKARMAFRYGIATMTALPHAFVRVTCEFGGRTRTGIAADHLPPKWFTKDPSRDPAEEIADMVTVIRRAQLHARSIGSAPTVFAFWRALWDRQEAWAQEGSVPRLLAHFGTSLVERAVIDAFCKDRGQPFVEALRSNSFGIDLGSIHPELAGTAPRDWLPGEPPRRVFARHTVGLSDPLTEAEISPGERLRDGLPQSLEECVAAYGLRHFKLKIGGPDDLPRLRSISAVLERTARDYACSLDGNEAFHSVEAFRRFWDGVCAEPALADLRRRLMFVEQPFHRDIALSGAIGALAAGWPDRPPIIIDESDSGLANLPKALALGYAGTSHKNCKGVFKGVANACLISHRRRAEPGSRLILSGEDLSNIGPVALMQDLAVQAALGVTSVERNGHHYFAGLSFWPPELQMQVREHHPDLYRDSPLGWPTLRIEDGQVSTESVLAAPFGVGFDLEPATLARLVD
jgi:L-alanine-DL-glutamate epimerase-like enolase superfamily enzyme